MAPLKCWIRASIQEIKLNTTQADLEAVDLTVKLAGLEAAVGAQRYPGDFGTDDVVISWQDAKYRAWNEYTLFSPMISLMTGPMTRLGEDTVSLERTKSLGGPQGQQRQQVDCKVHFVLYSLSKFFVDFKFSSFEMKFARKAQQAPFRVLDLRRVIGICLSVQACDSVGDAGAAPRKDGEENENGAKMPDNLVELSFTNMPKQKYGECKEVLQYKDMMIENRTVTVFI